MENKEVQVLLDDYEEGTWTPLAMVRFRKKWWQFWLPKFVKHDYAKYTKIGSVVEITILDAD